MHLEIDNPVVEVVCTTKKINLSKTREEKKINCSLVKKAKKKLFRLFSIARKSADIEKNKIQISAADTHIW